MIIVIGILATTVGSLINAFLRPEAWYATAGIIAGVVSAFIWLK